MAKRRYGQHFLADKGVINDIVAVFGAVPSERIIEIGPGRGALTRALLEAGLAVLAIEIDPRLVTALQPLKERYPALTVHHADALELDLTRVTTASQPLRIIGNLPYDISTALLLHLCAQIRQIRQMTVMLQKEVADRVMAVPGTRAYGRLSIALQLDCTALWHFDVPPQAFVPPPRVESSVLTLIPRPARYEIADPMLLHAIVGRAFGQRRKMLRNSLAAVVDTETLQRAGIDPHARAEDIAIERYVALSNLIAR